MEYQNESSGVNVYFELARVGPSAHKAIRLSLSTCQVFKSVV